MQFQNDRQPCPETHLLCPSTIPTGAERAVPRSHGKGEEAAAKWSCAALIASDLYRYFGKTDLRTHVQGFIHVPGFRYSFFLRKAQYYWLKRGALNRLIYFLFKIFLNHYRFRYGFDFSVRTQIGPGLYLGHFGRVTVNPKAILGSNINLSPGVTIGETYRGRKAGVPVIGDGVWIGTNAVVVGGISVGRNVLVAPNTFLNFDVPENSVVTGNPASIISQKGADGYVTSVVGVPPCQ